jgi:4-amino-4-deoxy-L-arabinose transferase-like glycosyltransferase
MTETADLTQTVTVAPRAESDSADGGSVEAGRPPLWRRLVLGDESDPRWVRPGLLVLLVGTAVLYLWQLSASGNANSFYAAAVQAGSKSWKAWFFGSLDTSNFITVDKPPAALWVMGLSARIFGYSSWSLLVPQALEGVAAVGILYAAVRRVAGPAAGLLAGAALALTPAAVLIFRFDNPDALLVLLLVVSAYCVTRALEAARTRWLVAAGAAIGFAFLTKSGQALLPVPALGLAYLVAAPTSVRRRVGQLLAALLAVVVSAGWWLLAVSVWPAADRPYIGGSTDNNPLQLAFGYNGLSRLFGGSGNGGGGGGRGGGGFGGTSFGGSTGLGRMFRGEFGLEISWLLPAALIALVAGIWLTWRRPRTDRARAALIVWGGWLLVTAGTFSFMKGTIHPYYTVALAPAVAATLGIGGVLLWRAHTVLSRAVLAVMVVLTAGWGLHLLRTNGSHTLAVALTVVAGIAALVALVALVLFGWRSSAPRRVLVTAALVTAVAIGVPSGAWALDTAATAHTGSIPTAVSSSGSSGGFGGPGGGGAPGGRAFGGGGGFGGGGFGGGGFGGAATGAATTASSLTSALEKTTTRWAAATVGSQTAATLELETGGKAVMAIGGFSGSDSAPSLAQFKAYVAAGDIRYFIAGGGFGGGRGFGGGGAGGSSDASQITSWVEAHYSSTTIGGQTVYDLTAAK